jgi:hypothetical protein
MASLNPAVFRLALACLALWASSANADSTPEALPAATLHALDGMAPAGRWAARLTRLRNGYDHRFDDGKNRVDMDVDANVALAPFGVDLDTEVTTEFAELLFGYGVTENLTVGAIVPWARTANRLRLAEAAPGGIAALRGTLAGLGYKPLGSRAVAGFSDPTLGALWRFHRSERDSAVLGFGVRMGLARDDDPDDLADIPPGDGSTDLRFRLEYFRDLGDGWDLRLLAEHQVQTPDDVAMRPGGAFQLRQGEAEAEPGRLPGIRHRTGQELRRLARFGNLAPLPGGAGPLHFPHRYRYRPAGGQYRHLGGPVARRHDLERHPRLARGTAVHAAHRQA